MKAKIIGVGLACLVMTFLAQVGFTTEIKILEYPKMVSQGQQVKVKISWKDFPVEKDYILRCQLEDKDSSFPIYIFQDISILQRTGEMSVTLSVPPTTTSTKTAKFIAAFISKAKGWDETLTTAETEKNIEIVSDFKFAILEYPTLVNKGSVAKVRISWTNVTAGKDYKLIVQLENWGEKPGFAYVTNIADFKPTDEMTISIKIPPEAKPSKNCRFVAAFISKKKFWNDVFAVLSTPSDVEITKYKII